MENLLFETIVFPIVQLQLAVSNYRLWFTQCIWNKTATYVYL
jgi:hypothetical protein